MGTKLSQRDNDNIRQALKARLAQRVSHSGGQLSVHTNQHHKKRRSKPRRRNASRAQKEEHEQEKSKQPSSSNHEGDDKKEETKKKKKKKDEKDDDKRESFLTLLLQTQQKDGTPSLRPSGWNFTAGLEISMMSRFWWLERRSTDQFIAIFMLAYLTQATFAFALGYAIFHNDLGTGSIAYTGLWMTPISFIWLSHRTDINAARTAMSEAITAFNREYMFPAASSRSVHRQIANLSREQDEELHRGDETEERQEYMRLRDQIEKKVDRSQVDAAAYAHVIHSIFLLIDEQNPYDVAGYATFLKKLIKRVYAFVPENERLTREQAGVVTNLVRQLQGTMSRSSTGFIYMAVWLLTAWVGPILSVHSHGLQSVIFIVFLSFIILILFMGITRKNRVDNVLLSNVETLYIMTAYAMTHGRDIEFRTIELDDDEKDTWKKICSKKKGGKDEDGDNDNNDDDEEDSDNKKGGDEEDSTNSTDAEAHRTPTGDAEVLGGENDTDAETHEQQHSDPQ